MHRPRRDARLISRSITVALVISCLGSLPASVVGRSPSRIGIGAFGGPDRVDRGVVVVIGGSAFQLDRTHAYMAMDVPTDTSLPIVVRDAATCRKLDAVTGRVGSHYELVFGADGFRRIADRGASGWDASLVVPPLTTRCLLPDTSTASAAGATPSPSPLAPPHASTAPTPSSTPFPWPTLPSPVEPAPATFEANGPPDATSTRHGVTVDLWLSSPTVGPGDSVEAVVRLTNTRSDPVWSYEGPCLTRPTVTADLSAVLDPGLAADGNAGELKRRVLAGSDLLVGEFDRRSSRRLPGASGITVSVLADCGPVGPSYARVGPGQTVEQHWTWVPVDPFDGYERWFRPLPPGPAPVTVTWRYAGHGSEASVRNDRQPHRPITATAALALTGTDPGLLSPQELVDRALADPEFAAWVEADPTREDWVDTDVDAWPGPDYPAQPRFAGLAGLAPNGVVEIALVRDLPGRPGVIGSAWVDPWTGEVLRFTTG